jgi:hypothetical protein
VDPLSIGPELSLLSTSGLKKRKEEKKSHQGNKKGKSCQSRQSKKEQREWIKKFGIMSSAGKWMELEIIVLSETSQAQKVKYGMFSVICGC